MGKWVIVAVVLMHILSGTLAITDLERRTKQLVRTVIGSAAVGLIGSIFQTTLIIVQQKKRAYR